MDFCRICAVDIPEDTQPFDIANLEKEFSFINTENIERENQLVICNDCLPMKITRALIKKAKERKHLVRKKIQDAVSKCATCQKFQCTCDDANINYTQNETIVDQNAAIGNQSLVTDDKTSDVSKQFQCDACACSFQTHDMLKGHNQVKHKQVKPKFKSLKCPKCDRTFRKKQNLKEHLQKHCKSKKFICDICKRKFQFKTSLRSHMGKGQ
ncbi:zinc finger imprinted 3-like [Sitodiplosis mosellana]|uniref:zinc finger imprinted 3-like n=1 Tax=Sitodiplosis mosellana TaxID=263140 RepID=UPI00244499F4|nr:zinc finger imprinted 3-like [Sitodiplosis mosellana]